MTGRVKTGMAGIVMAGAVAGVLTVVAGCNSASDNVKKAEKAIDQKTDSLNNKQSVTGSSNSVTSKQDADFIVKVASRSQFGGLGKLADTNGRSAG